MISIFHKEAMTLNLFQRSSTHKRNHHKWQCSEIHFQFQILPLTRTQLQGNYCLRIRHFTSSDCKICLVIRSICLATCSNCSTHLTIPKARITCLSTRSICLSTQTYVSSLVVLICSLIVFVWTIAVSVCPLAVLVVLSPGLFITDHLLGMH